MYVNFVISSVFTQRMPHDLAHPIVEKMDLGSQADPGPELTGICPEPRIKSLLNPYGAFREKKWNRLRPEGPTQPMM